MNFTPKHGTFPNAAVATDCGPASDVGVEMLKKGGHAVDAAIASMLCVGVFNCHSTGVGGGSLINIYDAGTDQHICIDCNETAPSKAFEAMYENDAMKGMIGTLAIGVPGEVMGYWEAHQRFGKLKWEELFEPAIKYAEEGVFITCGVALAIQRCEKYIRSDNSFNLASILLRTDGTLKKEGDVIVHKELAQTLRRISIEGAEEFYHGKLLGDVIKDILDGFGESIISVDDFEQYKVDIRELLKFDFDKLELVVPSPPSSGAVVGLILKIMEDFQRNTKLSEVDEVLVMHRIAEAFKFSFAARFLMADGLQHETELKDKFEQYVNSLSKQLRMKISDEQTYDVAYYNTCGTQQPNGSGTSHVSVLAVDGSAVSMTSTHNRYFGCKVRGVRTGIFFNSAMNDFSLPPPAQNSFGLAPCPSNFIRPGKRPISSMTPVILIDKEEEDVRAKVKMVVGASGGPRIMTVTALTIIRHLWLGKSLKDSVGDMRLHHQLIPNILHYEEGYDKDLLKGLEALGHELNSYNPMYSVAQAIGRVESDLLEAVSDGRKGGYPSGY